MTDSIRKQIITAVLVSQLLLAIGLTLAIVLYSRVQLLSAFNIMLEGRADSVLAVIHDSEDEANSLILDRERLSIPAGDLLEVWGEEGNLIWRSRNWYGAPATVLASNSPTFEFTTGQSSYRGIVVRKATIFDEEDNRPGPLRKVTIVYASSTRQLDRRIFRIGLFATGASVLLLLLSGWFAAYGVSRGLSPVQELAKEAARVSVRNWSFSPPQAARKKVELAPLVDAMEATLAGLQRAFNRERESTADAAHELKTAVAILKSSLQLLLCQPRSREEYKNGLSHSLEDCDRLEALVCGTLSLARAEQWADNGRLEDLQWVDLANSGQQAIADLQSLAEARGVELRCTVQDEHMVRADPLDLHTVWVNLLQNAIQHSARGSTVCMKVATSDKDTALVTVEDSGAGIPPEHLPYVFERFRRGDPSRSRATGGFGLGLSICKAIVLAYGGEIQIACPEKAGTRVSVLLHAIAGTAENGSAPLSLANGSRRSTAIEP
jgi:signal transduction histidine kinase